MRWRLLSIRMVILILSPPNYQGSCGSFFLRNGEFLEDRHSPASLGTGTLWSDSRCQKAWL